MVVTTACSLADCSVVWKVDEKADRWVERLVVMKAESSAVTKVVKTVWRWVDWRVGEKVDLMVVWLAVRMAGKKVERMVDSLD